MSTVAYATEIGSGAAAATCDISDAEGALLDGSECQMDINVACPPGKRPVNLPGGGKACPVCRAGVHELPLLLPGQRWAGTAAAVASWRRHHRPPAAIARRHILGHRRQLLRLRSGQVQQRSGLGRLQLAVPRGHSVARRCGA